jgi:hypothetical protein
VSEARATPPPDPPGRDGADDGAAAGAGESPAGRDARPSPPWYGALVTASLLLASAWLLSYTLLDLRWQQRLGAWNYLIALLISTAAGQLMQYWRGDGRRFGGRHFR